MAFTSITFLFLFLPIFFIIYYIIPFRAKNLAILIFSMVMVVSFDNLSAIVLLFSIAINFYFGRLVSKNKQVWILATGIILNIALLSVFKYHDLLSDLFCEISSIFSSTGKEVLSISSLIFPVGISFYTFRSISYLVDVYRKKTEPEPNFIDFAACLAFFPLLIAGPIARYTELKSELHTRKLSLPQIAAGIQRIITGLAFKVLIANTLGTVADQVFSIRSADLSTPMAWLGLVSYTMQIFFDFAGYTHMAIGIGMMLGFTFPENFNYPYVSRNIREFWRRWHMTLSSWLRDYLFLPSAYYFSKKWKKDAYAGIDTNHLLYGAATMITFIGCGLWHGSSLSFLIWGIYYGLFMILEQVFLKRALHRLWIPLQHLYAILVIMGGWVLFRSADLGQAMQLYQKLLVYSEGTASVNTYLSFFTVNRETLIILSCAFILSTPVVRELKTKMIMLAANRKGIVVTFSLLHLGFLFLLLIISLSYITAQTYNPFIYFRF